MPRVAVPSHTRPWESSRSDVTSTKETSLVAPRIAAKLVLLLSLAARCSDAIHIAPSRVSSTDFTFRFTRPHSGRPRNDAARPS